MMIMVVGVESDVRTSLTWCRVGRACVVSIRVDCEKLYKKDYESTVCFFYSYHLYRPTEPSTRTIIFAKVLMCEGV